MKFGHSQKPENNIENREAIKNPEVRFLSFDPRVKHQDTKVSKDAKEHNNKIVQQAKDQGHMLIGVEVTGELADLCEQNIDPQHTGGMSDKAAIEVALKIPELNDGNNSVVFMAGGSDATMKVLDLVTVRHDMDAVGSMSVLQLRIEGHDFTDEQRQRIDWVAVMDKFEHGAWQPGKVQRPIYGENKWEDVIMGDHRFNRQGVAGIGKAIADHQLAIGQKVEAMRSWILEGVQPKTYLEQAMRSRQDLVKSVESGETELGWNDDNNRLVRTVNTVIPYGVSQFAYVDAPVIVLYNPEMKSGNTVIRKFTIMQYADGYVDMDAVISEIAKLEEGWGGQPNSKGSPFSGTSLGVETVVRIVANHVRYTAADLSNPNAKIWKR